VKQKLGFWEVFGQAAAEIRAAAAGLAHELGHV